MSFGFVNTPDPLYIESKKEALYWLDRYMARDTIGFDTETTGLNLMKDHIKFFSFSDGASRICGPVRLLEVFRPLITARHISKRMSNGKCDMHMCANEGILIGGNILDTQAADWDLDENELNGLKPAALRHLGLRMNTFKDTFGNVGGVDKEVECQCRVHDVLEANDAGAAADLLVYMRRAGGEESVLKDLQKLHMAKMSGYILDAKKLLSIGRAHELIPVVTGRLAHVSNFIEWTTGQIVAKEDREKMAYLLEDRNLIEDAHELLLRALRKQIRVDMEPLEMLRLLIADYASLDAWASYTLIDVYIEKLAEIEMDQGWTLLDHFLESDTLYTRVLWNMERRGVPYDVEKSEQYAVPMSKEIAGIERKLVHDTGNLELNLQSTPQMRDLFYSQNTQGEWCDPFNNPVRYWTKGGASGIKMPSTAEKALQEWADRGNSLAEEILHHRELVKLHGSFLDTEALPRWVDLRGRIHTGLKQQGTVTGRLSSSEPNLQQIPSKGDWGSKLRELFIAGVYGDCNPDWCLPGMEDIPVPDLDPQQPMTLIVADYKQIEVRVAAHLCQDPTMVNAILNGLDLHCLTASRITGIPYEDFVAAKKAHERGMATPAQEKLVEIRSGSKSATFGIFYGIGAVKLGGQLKLPIIQSRGKNGRVYEKCPEGEAFIDGVFQTYPGLKNKIEQTHEDCRADLFVRTIAGRYRRLPEITSEDRGIEAMAERQSFNSMVQGSAADITKQAMFNCESDPELRMLGVRMLLQIHDELMFECPDIPEYVEAAKIRIKACMENPIKLIVPMTISIGSGPTWGSAKV